LALSIAQRAYQENYLCTFKELLPHSYDQDTATAILSFAIGSLAPLVVLAAKKHGIQKGYVIEILAGRLLIKLQCLAYY